MKLRFIKKPEKKKLINEADIDRGKRLKLADEIAAQIEPVIKKAGYNFKSSHDNGFYILPKNGYLSKITITVNTEDGFDVRVLDSRENEILNQKFAVVDLQDEQKTKVLGDAIEKTLLTPKKILEEDLTENIITEGKIGDLFKALGSKIKDVAGTIDDKITDKAAEVGDHFDKKAVDAQENKNILKAFKEMQDPIVNQLQAAINATAQGRNDIKIESKAEDKQMVIWLNSKYIAGVVYGIPQDKTQLIVKECITPLGTANIVGNSKVNSVNKFLTLLGKKLGFNASLKNDPTATSGATDNSNNIEQSKEGAENDSAQKSNNVDKYEKQLKSQMNAEMIDALKESLSEATFELANNTNSKNATPKAFTFGPSDSNTQKFDDALKKAEDGYQLRALIRLFFYKASNNKITHLTDIVLNQLVDTLEQVKTFNVELNHIYNACLTYAQMNGNDIHPSLIPFLEEIGVNKAVVKDHNAPFYQAQFFNSNKLSTAALADCYDKYITLKNNKDLTKTEAIEELKEKTGIDIPANIDVNEIVNIIFFKDLKTLTFRPLNVINDIAKSMIAKTQGKDQSEIDDDDIENSGSDANLNDLMQDAKNGRDVDATLLMKKIKASRKWTTAKKKAAIQAMIKVLDTESSRT